MAGRPTISARSTNLPYILSIGSLIQTSTPQSFIWGTGLIHPSAGIGNPDARRILAVRGKLSHAELVRNGVRIGDVPLGDPGSSDPATTSAERVTDRPLFAWSRPALRRSRPPIFLLRRPGKTERQAFSTSAIQSMYSVPRSHPATQSQAPHCMDWCSARPWDFRTAWLKSPTRSSGKASSLPIGFRSPAPAARASASSALQLGCLKSSPGWRAAASRPARLGGRRNFDVIIGCVQPDSAAAAGDDSGRGLSRAAAARVYRFAQRCEPSAADDCVVSAPGSGGRNRSLR